MKDMEIERKFLIKEVPAEAQAAEKLVIEQAYLCRKPVVRVRRANDDYYLTYKGGGMMAREEYNLPLTAEAYKTLRAKADGTIIRKTRHLIPYCSAGEEYLIELDLFENPNPGLWMAEVEFESIEKAEGFEPPAWFGTEVTYDKRYHNSNM